MYLTDVSFSRLDKPADELPESGKSFVRNSIGRWAPAWVKLKPTPPLLIAANCPKVLCTDFERHRNEQAVQRLGLAARWFPTLVCGAVLPL
ncbi:MAG: hypothetical protein E5X43_36250 [Mesorhizobium sp.]|nr:MAG: hypothetical protein E5X43_36250 [Mesorhizobium sp.]